MKAIKANGLKLEMVDIDYDFLKEQMEDFVKNNKMKKAEALRKLLTELEELEREGRKITLDLIEETVNKIIDANFLESKKLKDKIKELDQENQILSLYSKREMDNDTTSSLISIINLI